MINSKNPLKILVLTNNIGELSEDLQFTINGLTVGDKVQFENELAVTANEARVEQFAEEIIRNKYNIVLIDEKVKSSAWGIIRKCHIKGKETPSDIPKFYLDGKSEDLLRREFENSKLSGAVKIDQIDEERNISTLFSGAYGQANRSASETVPNSVDTKFCIGSITKMFTAVAVLIMADKFQLDLNTPIKTLLKNCDAEYPHEDIFDDFTLHELLTHTSGFPPGIEDPFFKTDMIQFERLEQYLPWIQSLHQDENIADRHQQKQFQYSNGGMFLLGFAIEAITGKDYYTFVQENIFQLVGMDNTVIRRESGDPSYAIPQTTRPSLPSPDEMNWLNTLLSDENNPLHEFAGEAHKWTEYTEKYNQENIQVVQELIDEFQTMLAKAKDPNEFSKLRGEFESLILKSSKYFEKYEKDFSTFNQNDQKLRQWIDANKGKPGCDDAIKLHATIFQKISKNLNWPFDTLQALTINLSLAHPAGKFFSTVNDMTAFQNALWGKDGKLAKYAAQLVKETVPVDPLGRDHYGYGIEVRNEGKTVGHSGAVAGGTASCYTYRDSGYTVVALSNSDQATFEMTADIERNFVHGAEHGVMYFDPAVNPNAKQMLNQNIDDLLATGSDDESSQLGPQPSS